MKTMKIECLDNILGKYRNIYYGEKDFCRYFPPQSKEMIIAKTPSKSKF